MRADPSIECRRVQDGGSSADIDVGIQLHPRYASRITTRFRNLGRARQASNADGDDLHSGHAAIIEARFDGRPREPVIPLDGTKRLEVAHVPHRCDISEEREPHDSR